MPKHYVDPEVWDEDWFANLDQPYQMLWLFIWTKSDLAGIWNASQKIASRYVPGVDLAKALIAFGGRAVDLGTGKWILPGVIRIHNAKGLRPGNNATDAVIALLASNHLEVDSSGFPDLTRFLALAAPGQGPARVPIISLYSYSHINPNLETESIEPLSQDVTSPTPEGVTDGYVNPEHRWLYERGLPWCRTLKAHLAPINKNNWEDFKGLWDRFGEDFVVKMLKRMAGRFKWSNEFVDACVQAHDEECAEPVEYYHSDHDKQVDREHEQIRGIFARLGGWHRVLTALGMPLADRDPSDDRWLWETIMPGNGSLREELLALADKPDLTHLANAVPCGVLATIGADPSPGTVGQ